jgi:DNA (cytosine-5)-methyltransferase 1
MQECISFQPGNLRRDAGAEPNAETTTTLKASMGDQIPHIATPMAVRRLLPSECEALQGFPKGWTDITWNGKPAPDGHRYKAIGNSMATNCMHWIGRRIQMVDDLVTELNNKQG